MRAEQPQYARGRGLADAAHPGPLDGADQRADAATRLLAPQRQDVLRQRLGQRAAGTRVLARCGLERLEAAAFVCVVPGLERAPAQADAPSLRVSYVRVAAASLLPLQRADPEQRRRLALATASSLRHIEGWQLRRPSVA